MVLGTIATLLLVLGGAVVYTRSGGWGTALGSVQLFYLNHVPPLMWPAETFTAADWQSSPVGERYRFARSLIGGDSLLGLTQTEVSDTLGGQPSKTGRAIYQLRHTGSQNLWWVLVADFERGRVAEVRREVAWLDP